MEAILLLKRNQVSLSCFMAYLAMGSRVKMCTSQFPYLGHPVIMAENVHGSSAQPRAVAKE
jgi:hypothetical protein